MGNLEGNEVVSDDETTDDTVGIDYDSMEVDDESNDTDEGDSQEDETSNPAWKPILDLIPEQLHSQVIPHLSKTNKHVQQLEQTYAPYKQFIDQGITADVLSQGLTLGQAIANDPQAVYDALREKFNLSHEEAIQTLNDGQDDNDEDNEQYGDGDGEDYEEDEIDLDDAISQHPAFRQLQERAEQQEQREQEYFRTQQLESIKQEVDKEWTEIEAKAGGKLSQDVKDDIMMRALNIAGEGIPSLMSGFKAHVKFITKTRNSTANNRAPSVSDGTGLLPGSEKYDINTSEGRQELMVARMRKMGITEG